MCPPLPAAANGNVPRWRPLRRESRSEHSPFITLETANPFVIRAVPERRVVGGVRNHHHIRSVGCRALLGGNRRALQLTGIDIETFDIVFQPAHRSAVTITLSQ